MIHRIDTGRLVRALLVLALPLAAACNDGALMPPKAADPLFDRYVSMGNSLTAGFQSGGMNDSTQREAYPVLLAQAMGTDFTVPFLANPGCPAPYVNIFEQTRVGGAAAPPCALREAPTPVRINQLAIPGAPVVEMFDYLTPGRTPSAYDPLKTFLLGGLTPLDWARKDEPTFVTIAIGSNDLLGAGLDPDNPGDPALVTPAAEYAATLNALLDSLDQIGTVQGGVLIGIQPLLYATGTSVPYFSPGAAWMQFEPVFDAMTAPLNALDVNVACATAFVPFTIGGGALALAQARVDSVLAGLLAPGNLVTVNITCADDQAITGAEMQNLVTTAAAYNAAMQQAATDRDWLYFDPAPVFNQLAAMAGAFRPFPAFLPTDPQHETQPFGFAISRDGIHWNALMHESIAAALIDAINDHYGTSLETP
jgi:lysophospholipase L1-like esterase